MATVEELEAAGVRILRLVYADLHGKQRGKDVLLERAGHAIAHAVKDAVKLEVRAIADVLVHIEPADDEVTKA